MAKFHVNGEQVDFRGAPDTPLLWVIRDHLGLTGTKYGCGVAQCGACTVHVGGEPVRACMTPVSSLEGKRVITIEGVAATSQARVARAGGGQCALRAHRPARAFVAAWRHEVGVA